MPVISEARPPHYASGELEGWFGRELMTGARAPSASLCVCVGVLVCVCVCVALACPMLTQRRAARAAAVAWTGALVTELAPCTQSTIWDKGTAPAAHSSSKLHPHTC